MFTKLSSHVLYLKNKKEKRYINKIYILTPVQFYTCNEKREYIQNVQMFYFLSTFVHLLCMLIQTRGDL